MNSSAAVPRTKACEEAKDRGPAVLFSSKIQPQHLLRWAIVYVRQSTPQQVLEHRESTARQYALVERAVALGWPRERVLVIDEDQGHSGSTAEGRPGFQRLLAEVSLDQVGIVLGLEMSRLARSCKDWHALLELCALFGTLLGDADGLYDPADYNDRLLLGLKGTMSEAELHILKSRLHRGMWNKAMRGELRNHAPMGYVRTAGGDYVLDPDEQAQAVVRLVFEQFAQLRSVNALLCWLVQQGVKLPVRPHFGVNRGELEWRRPNRVTLLNMLHHPIYAGAYRWGHREVDPRKKVAGQPGSGRTLRSHDRCRVLIRDRYPAYISWAEFEANQQRLAENGARGEALSAPRHGPSVLSGLVVCGRCGHRMLVAYAAQNRLRYTCQRAALDYGGPACQSLSGEVLERFVGERLLKALQPATLELSLAAAEDLEQERARLDAHWQQRLERAAYDAQLALRQYQAVEPEHRLVARELERRWEQSLRAQQELQEEHARWQRESPSRLSCEERARIRRLAEDLPALWHAPTTTPADRQTIARMLLERVVVTVEGKSSHMEIVLHWAGGFTSRHTLSRPVQTYGQLSNYEQLVERIDGLREEGRSLVQIADTLNHEGFHPPKRAARFTGAMLSVLLRQRGRRTSPSPRAVTAGGNLQPDEWWLGDLAQRLGMPVATLHRWRKVGWVAARKVPVAGGRWALWADADELARLGRLRTHRRGWPDEPYPQELTTPQTRPRGVE